jgi:hypothetical protein
MNHSNRPVGHRNGPPPERKVPNAYRGRTPEGRASPEEPDTERLVIATLNIRMATGTWTMKFTQAHPEVRAEVLNRSDIDKDVAVSDYWISGGPPGVWSREIQSYPDVVKVDALAEVGEGSIYRVTDRNPPVVYLYRRLGVPLQFPMRMQAGFIRWEVVSRRTEFEQILRYARVVDPQVQVLSIRNGPLRSHLPILTGAQQALLTRAMAEGYFAVPRGITLTELAKRVNRSKSSVSEAIATIEKKLLESALGPPALSN